jgi:hypothetical protein
MGGGPVGSWAAGAVSRACASVFILAATNFGQSTKSVVVGLSETCCVTIVAMVRRVEAGTFEGLIASFQCAVCWEAVDLPTRVFTELVHGMALLCFTCTQSSCQQNVREWDNARAGYKRKH